MTDNLKKKLWISFSGGRTSAYMTKWLLDNRVSKDYHRICLPEYNPFQLYN